MVAPARPIGAAGGHSPGKDAANCEPDGAIVERHLSLDSQSRYSKLAIFFNVIDELATAKLMELQPQTLDL